MSFEVPPLSSTDALRRSQAVSRTDKPELAQTGDTEEVRLDTLPSSPPAELHPEIDRAAARVDELRAKGRELHFSFDRDAGRVEIQVRDLNGKVIRTIPPSKALAVASGEELD